MGRIVGIDLGTTNSVVAVLEGGRPQVIASAEGGRTTPSVLGFNRDQELLVGQLARRQLVLNPRNTFANLKRYVGRRWDELEEGSLAVPYTIRANDQGNVRVVCPATEREYAPEELVASLLRKLVDDAGTYLGEPVEAAVITVPAYFNDAQRQATRDAGRLAGISVERILNEPTAAALAYGFDRSAVKRVLVFDLGGGTFDVSVLRIANGVFDVKATSGDTQLGGNDWDRRIVDWLAEAFLAQHQIDLRRDRQALQRLTEAAEKAKQELSGVQSTPISLPFIATADAGPLHIETTLERRTFEGLCGDLLDRLLRPVQRALRDSGLAAEDIDDVVLVGGGTRMPMVQAMVRTLVPLEPCQSVNPDEVVAIGAAVQAGILTGELRDLMLNDVSPLSLGLETIGGVMKVLIARNTPIPVRKSDVFSTSEANQNSVEIHVLQGERQMAGDNKSLGRFRLSGIPPAPRGVPQVQVSFDIDANGLLQVSATDRTTGRQQSVSIQGGSNLSEEEVQRLLAEAELKATEDRRKRSEIDRRNRAQTLVSQAERRLRDAALELGPFGADRQQRAVEQGLRLVQDLLAAGDLAELEVAVSELQEALYGLNRRLSSERRAEAGGPLQGLKNTLGSLKDELFADDEWDDWDRGGSRRDLQDPWRDGLSRQGSWNQASWGSSGALGGAADGAFKGDGRDRFEPRADWNQGRDRDRAFDRSFDRQEERSFNRQDIRSFDRQEERSFDRQDDRLGNPPTRRPSGGMAERPGPAIGDWSQGRWDQSQADRRPDPPVERSGERRFDLAAPGNGDPSWERQPAIPSDRYRDGDLDPYAGEGGANPSYGQAWSGPRSARPRPTQDDPWAGD